MKCKFLVAMFFVAGCAPALASQQIAPVQVTGSPDFALAFDCANPARPSHADVVRLLDIHDTSHTNRLGSQLMGVVGKACVAGVPAIVVSRTRAGERLIWAPLNDQAVSVAAN